MDNFNYEYFKDYFNQHIYNESIVWSPSSEVIERAIDTNEEHLFYPKNIFRETPYDIILYFFFKNKIQIMELKVVNGEKEFLITTIPTTSISKIQLAFSSYSFNERKLIIEFNNNQEPLVFEGKKDTTRGWAARFDVRLEEIYKSLSKAP